MVYDSETYVVLHRLTKAGEKRYREMLERVADQILWDHEHPIKAFFRRLRNGFRKDYARKLKTEL